MSESPGQLSPEGERLLALRLSGLAGASPLPGAGPSPDGPSPDGPSPDGPSPDGPSPDGRSRLSLDQQRLWFIDQADPGMLAYNVHGAYRLRGELDIAALRLALRYVVTRHDVLRAKVVTSGGEPYQVAAPPPDDVLRVRDFSGEPDPLAAAREYGAACADARIMLAKGPLFRAWLARLADTDHVVGFVVHHIVFDRDSLNIWAAEVGAAYAAFRAGGAPQLPPLAARYGDYVQWQRRQAGRCERQRDYWRQHLRGVSVAMDLPFDHPRRKQPSYRAGSVPILVPSGLARRLRALARQQRTTMFAVALAALQGLLFRYSPAAGTIVVGCPANGRARPEFEGLIGFFTRSLPLAAFRPDGIDPPFDAMVSQARDALLGAHAHQDVPFDEIVRLASPPRDLGHNPLFQVWFDLVTRSPAASGGLPLPGLAVTEFETSLIRTRFDLEFHLADESSGRLSGRLIFATDLFEPATAWAFARHYERFLSAVATEPGIGLSEIPILTADEQHTILDEWSAAR